MVLKFKCAKHTLEDALKKLVGITNPVIVDKSDVENAVTLLMDAIGIEHSVDGGNLLVPRGCDVQEDEDEVTIGLGAGSVLLIFGAPGDLSEPDKKWMQEQFRILQNAVLARAEYKDDDSP